MIQSRNIQRQYTCWTISTGYEESYDINNQIEKVITILKERIIDLKELKNMFNLDYKIEVVINIKHGEIPSIYLKQDVIEFMHSINGWIDFDIYNYS